MARGFLTSRLSDHIGETDEGFLIVRDCPIARTGFQEYSIRDLPQDSARDLGVDVSNPNAMIDLYRPDSEVFSEDFIRSLNGKPITDGHPEGMVNPDNFQEYSCGHIENVRKGKEPLEDGEWPLIADLVICAEPLISEVRNKTKREISLGYDFGIGKDDGKIIQEGMLGNHCAVVPHGRAGSSVRIHDAASTAAPDLVVPAATAVQTTKKEKTKVAKLDWKHIWGLGLRALAQDAEVEPSQLAEASQQAAPPVAEEVEDKKAKDKKKAKDTEEELEALKLENEKLSGELQSKRLELDGLVGKSDESEVYALEKEVSDLEREEQNLLEKYQKCSIVKDQLHNWVLKIYNVLLSVMEKSNKHPEEISKLKILDKENTEQMFVEMCQIIEKLVDLYGHVEGDKKITIKGLATQQT